jgi:hypothetical protein
VPQRENPNLRCVVEGKARGALDIIVSAVPQGAMRADDDLLAATWKLCRDKLLLVVLFEGRRELGYDTRVVDGQGLDICVELMVRQAPLSENSDVGGSVIPAITSASYGRAHSGSACW